MKTIEISSIDKYYKNILEYIFFLNESKIDNFKYLEEYLYYSVFYPYSAFRKKNVTYSHLSVYKRINKPKY